MNLLYTALQNWRKILKRQRAYVVGYYEKWLHLQSSHPMEGICQCTNAYIPVIPGAFSWGTLQQHQHYSRELRLCPNWLSFSLHHNVIFVCFGPWPHVKVYTELTETAMGTQLLLFCCCFIYMYLHLYKQHLPTLTM